MSKPIPAIVESEHEQVIAAVRSAFSASREADVQAGKAADRAEKAKGASDLRRLEAGRALLAARRIWPSAKAAQGGARGPGGKTWSQFLEAEGISESTAWRYLELAGYVEGREDDGSLQVKGPSDVPTYAAAGIGARADRPDPFIPVESRDIVRPRFGFDLKLGRWQDVLKATGQVDVVLCDPPFSARTHESRTTRYDGHDPDGMTPDYRPWTPDDVLAFVKAWHPRTRGWIVALTDDILAPAWRAAFVAVGRVDFAPVPCVIQGMSVRAQGDGPSSWAVYAMVGRQSGGEFAKWGTLPGAYVGGRESGAENGRGKPLWLSDKLVRDYSRPNDLVCDPLAGYGGTLISAIDLGRRAIGAELDHGAYDEAFRRAAIPREIENSAAAPAPDAAATTH